ncbi:hypothetical protein O9H85_19155 [Paenibacillus filicis]|uniref:Uncharacterized protein n=1 Tax=Paenibacillus gyeongsangnamensis TaxID=3388067 RepID=A0ABT4QCA1_9BACL|nr:hypothetical protein [Paenibacillus filicis]MCZ8514500.1 hypothetical protein [Paenibacillus filicis]
MFYTLTEEPVSTTIEYHIIYSHEDAGTPAPLLLSKWGRLTDIEWTYRVVLDAEGVVQEAVYQGPHHVTSRFRGLYGLGGLPMLQAATDNGMVTDIPDSSYRFLLAPVMRWEPHREPRERIMDAFPFTYPMMAWEALRHERPEVPANPATTALADPRCYLYVQTSKMTGRPEQNQGTSIDIRVKLKDDDRWYSSSFGDLRLDGFRAAYDGPYPQFSTTVKLYDGIALNRIERIEAVLLPVGAGAITVKGLKAFFLGPDYLPERPLIVEGEWKLSRRRPSAPLWQALQPV